MAFPEIAPTSRSFDPGDFPSKTYNSQSGSEIRILYGSQRTKMKLSLGYENITDANADLFLTHYESVNGTFSTFELPSAVFSGWSGLASSLDASGSNSWRYEQPPQVASVRPGLSSVTISLIGVL